jgi:hypothetical protein
LREEKSMGSNPDSMIKKAITETITEELFRDLGFIILRFGQEHTLNPIVQLENFIKATGGKFELAKKDKEVFTPRDWISYSPDFILIHPNGYINFLEVKYRYNAELWDQDFEVFDIYPEAILMVINSFISEKILNEEGFSKDTSPEFIKEVRKSRFHIHLFEEGTETGITTTTNSLKGWLKAKFDISEDEVIDDYESILSKWLPATEQK